MKKGLVFVLLFILLVMPFVFAENEVAADSETSSSESSKIDDAYNCLKDKIKDDCSTSLTENIFTLLAIGECEKEVRDASDNNECWPAGNCNFKTTAQAILALDNAGASTSDAEDWLLSQTKIPEDMIWYLEIESSEETTCSISYSDLEYQIIIGADKKINSGAGSCLSLSQGSYWLEVSSSCYGTEFEISCDEQFLTTLLFKRKTSSTIHVSEQTSSAAAEGTTKETIESSCFTLGESCDYEGTLWASLVLNNLGYSTSDYLPYLIIMIDGNEKYLPEVFLYLITGYTDFRTDLLLRQKGTYWDESGDKFYDTALALYPFQYEEPAEKGNSKNWLLDIQGDDGCWDNGNIFHTAFILHSVWPKSKGSGSGTGDIDCEEAGYYCMSGANCEGEILKSYDCTGIFKCCDTPSSLEECSSQGGKICTSYEHCSGGTTVDASDLDYEEICCLGGYCEEQDKSNTASCGETGGICRPYECKGNEEQSFYYDCDYGDICCVSKSSSDKSYWWIWLLLILIILLILAIIFRDRLGPYYNKVKSKFGKGKPKPGMGQGGIPMISPIPMRPMPQRPVQRRILPPGQRRMPVRRPFPRRRPSEIDNVLKRLKEKRK